MAYKGRGQGSGMARGRKSEGSTADTTRKRPERPWTAARTMEVLRRHPLAITGVPGEIKRSRDLRGGRWSWTLTFAQKRS